MFETLYKIDNKNKIREWSVTVEDLGTYAEIIVTHGQQDGKQQEKITKITQGKNIGKKNATTYLDQAYSEATSKWNKQRDKGYGLTPEKVFNPMLAHVYGDYKHKLIFPCYVQPKLDGIRYLLRYDSKLGVVGRTRGNKEYHTIDHIIQEVEDFLRNNPDLIIDGELFTTEISFQKICSAFKRDEPNEYTQFIEFWCYDVYSKKDKKMPFGSRMELRPDPSKYIKKVDTVKCHDFQEVDICHHNYVENGYEGTIIRNRAGIYKTGRSFDLLKYKDFQDSEYKIVDKYCDKNGETVFVCVDEILNKTFECKPRGTHEERVEMLSEDNIGKMLTVRYFELTESGLPRFPVGWGIRND